MISLIAAYAYNRDGKPVIGRGGSIPWNLPEDMAWFRSHTLHKTIVMGRTTYESIPSGALKNRRIAVLTGDPDYALPVTPDKAFVVNNHQALVDEYAGNDNRGHLVVCGGSSVYQKFLSSASAVLLTEIHKTYEGDVFLPFTLNDLKTIHKFTVVMIDKNERRFRENPPDIDWTHYLLTRLNGA